jgi:hypothetical protein|uniref:Uncharacterized protein n=1 Tax=Siphoviridae sp. ctuy39 TaxID=2825719 RepID=A0A8S5VEN9_9CAUD|nr:MAG TPA: hypothetical protein [Siphoviridae sp. ctuy39]
MKLTQLASLQKIIAYSIVIMAAKSGMDPIIVGFGCAFGIFLNEVADVWYKIIPSRVPAVEIKKSA